MFPANLKYLLHAECVMLINEIPRKGMNPTSNKSGFCNGQNFSSDSQERFSFPRDNRKPGNLSNQCYVAGKTLHNTKIDIISVAAGININIHCLLVTFIFPIPAISQTIAGK